MQQTYALTIESIDDALLVRLKTDVHKLLAAYERASSDGHTKRGALLAANNVRLTRKN